MNNLDTGIDHPYHLHGAEFYIVARGNGTITSSTYSGLTFTTSNPPRRDTVRQPPSKLKSVQLTHALMNQIVIPRNSYAVLRFVTDDPGVWPLHCHIGWHLAGMSAMLHLLAWGTNE